jgi:pimeloyl-ACP methyl ester carboxylesterase
MRSYHIQRQLADQLADEGNYVFRFDWFGYGDSAGENGDGTVAIWVNNIIDAADEIQSMSGCNKLSLIGFRIGAALAWQAVSMLSNVKNLVLWEPVTGQNWFAELEKMQKEFLASTVCSGSQSLDGEYLGFLFPTVLQRELRLLDFQNKAIPSGCRIHLFAPEKKSGKDESLKDVLSYEDSSLIEFTGEPEGWSSVHLADRVIMNNHARPKIVKLFSRAVP